MKKPAKIALISIPSVIAAAVTAVSVAAYVSKPENYIKRYFPNAQILDIKHDSSGFLFHYVSYVEYKLYDTENEFMFYQRFSEGVFPKALDKFNSSYSYDHFMKKKDIYDRFLAEIPALYSGEYFSRYDLNSNGLYIFLKEPEYGAVCDLKTALNASENKTEYVLYCLPADIYEQMEEQDFKKLSAMDDKEPYHSYCYNLIEMFLELRNDLNRTSYNVTPEMFDMGNALVIRSGYKDANAVDLVYAKHYY